MSAKLQALLERQEQIANQIRAEKAKEQKRDRKLETRRKVLIGALVREMMEDDAELKANITKRLESYLTRPIDRELFGFAMPDEATSPDKPEEQAASAA